MSVFGQSPQSGVSGLPGGSRRPSRFNSSIAMPPRPDFSRRSSALSSASGTPNGRKGSTVSALNGRLSRRRARKEAEGTQGEENDWAGLEPDEVFRKLPVGEVKKVENQLRAEALNKQSELRSMVGTRYRDLLLSTTQITALHSSSLRLSSSLQAIGKACANPEGSQPVLESGAASVDGDAEASASDAVAQLPLAAHMKLLLDAPETLYSQLSRHSYLNAAFLWLLSRVVKEGVTTSAPSESQPIPYLPLMQKQWETLLPFRLQIVQRATASLRERGANAVTSAHTLAHTLVAIILLDSISVAEALSLFLAQRMRTLRDILQSTRPAALSAISQDRRSNQDETKRLLSPAGSRRNSLVGGSGLRSGSRSVSRVGSRRGSFSDQKGHGRPVRAPRPPLPTRASTTARDAQAERDKTTTVLVEAVHCLVNTTVLVREVFDKRKGGKGESLIEELMRKVQEGEDPVQPSSQPMVSESSAPLSNSAKVHQRRASRLASMSMPMPKISLLSSPSGSSKIAVVTTASLLQSLPSAQILLRYLPPSILAFTPFISSSTTASGLATPQLGDKLSQWHESALSQITSAAPSWLHSIGKVKDVWQIRGIVHDALKSVSGGEREEEEIRAAEHALDVEWARRAKAVWAERLEEIVKLLAYKIEDGVDAIRRGDVDVAQDVNPSSFLFAPDVAFPAAPSPSFAASSSQNSAFQSFIAVLEKRATNRTPQLDAVLAVVEALSADLKSDLASIRDSREDLFTDYEFKMRHACDRIATSLKKELETIGKDKNGDRVVESELFVGRVALHLAKNSTFIDMLRGGREDLDLDGFVHTLAEIHTASLRRWTSRMASQAAATLDPSSSLHFRAPGDASGLTPSPSVSTAMRELTLAVKSLGLPPNIESTAITSLVSEFVSKATTQLEKRREGSPSQVEVDLLLLARLSREHVQKEASEATTEQSELQAAVTQYLQRTQVLFAPISTLHSSATLGAALPTGHTSGLLRLGAAAGDSGDLKGLLATAEVGKRFNLLHA